MKCFARTSALLAALFVHHYAVAQSVPTPAINGVTPTTTAQDTVDVQHVMEAFHEAVVTHNGTRLSALFIPEGSTWLNVMSDTAYEAAKAKSPQAKKVRVSTYAPFANLVSTTKDRLDPRHTNVQIKTDGTVASVYFDFVFYINDKPQNHGSETWQLVKGTDGWRIAAITYSSTPGPV